jgi:NitT/TauT family transport system ATP-binding protein
VTRELPGLSSSEAVLRFEHVSVRIGAHEVITPTDLEITRGEFVCIVGPSGCGKTTLLRTAAGLLRPATGEVRWQGRPIDGPWPQMALVFQDYGRALLPWRTVQGNVALALEAAGVPAAERPALIAQALHQVGLQHQAQRFPAQLSGGMQQRVQIARCLAQRPQLMLLDEPFGALDALTRQTLQDELARLVRDQGLTVLFVTHDLDEALYLGDRVIAMRTRPGPGRPSLARAIEVPIPHPRHQLATREDARFLDLRRELFQHVEQAHG